MECLSEDLKDLLDPGPFSKIKRNCVIRLCLSNVIDKWVKVFKNGPSIICGRQPLKNLKWHGPPKQTISPQIFLKAVFHKFYLVHSRISWPKYTVETLYRGHAIQRTLFTLFAQTGRMTVCNVHVFSRR